MNSTFPVVESFHSIQGEGVHTGKSAFFIRLASCKVGCPWCDTKISWSEAGYPQKTCLEISNDMSEAQSQGASFVVITGGEPLHHNLDPLCDAMRQHSLQKRNKSIAIHLETSGVDQLSGNPDWITLSPKRHSPPNLELLVACHELKVIIHEQDDLVFAETMATQIHSNSNQLPEFFLQPGWKNTTGQQLALEYVKNNPQWRLSLQIHKWLKIS